MTEDRANVPLWITKHYIQEVLQQKFTTQLQVKSFTAVPPVAAGNNYASLILRVTAQCIEKGVTKEHSLIIKTIHYNEESAKLLEEFGAHANEMKMYSDVLPKIQNLLESIGDHDKISPGAIHIDQKHQAMIFEDLKESNYKLGDRKVGLDWDHMKIIARKHAKLHACSMVLAEKGEKFEAFQKSLLDEDFPGFHPVFVQNCLEFGGEIQKWPGYEKYGDKLVKLSERLVAQGIEMYKKKPGQTNVLNHGDSWTSNMMFKYNENGLVTDGILLDFQICSYGSPIFDLTYFYNTSATDEIKFDYTKFHELLKLYHFHLSKALKGLGYQAKVPTLFELNQEYYQRSFTDVFYLTLIFPIMTNENEKDADTQHIMGTTEECKVFRRELFGNPKVVRTVKHFLPIWDAKGLLDPLQ